MEHFVLFHHDYEVNTLPVDKELLKLAHQTENREGKFQRELPPYLQGGILKKQERPQKKQSEKSRGPGDLILSLRFPLPVSILLFPPSCAIVKAKV